MNFLTPISQLKMVGPVLSKKLSKLNIETIEDLLYHFPFRYEDYSHFSNINSIKINQNTTIKARVFSVKNEYTKNGRKIQKAVVFDGTKELEIIWFNQPFLMRSIKVGEWYNFSGKVEWFGRSIVMIMPDYEILQANSPSVHTGRLVPIYPETRGVSSKWLRSRIFSLINNFFYLINDFLPSEIIQSYKLLELNQAIKLIHFPTTQADVGQAKTRLAFDELFLTQLSSLDRRRNWKKQATTYKFAVSNETVIKFLDSLPFKLTPSQQTCAAEICSDLSSDTSMNRLLEGDVGSGKTVVAALAVLVAYLNNAQTAFMAPTEILAKQHFDTLNKFLSSFGIKSTLITGSTSRKNLDNEVNLVIGTHALIYNQSYFKNLGLVIIDEQHRFGVEQRGELVKKGHTPHVLTMTATPIPRTIALTVLGDLDLSVIKEMPPGKAVTKTWVVPESKRNSAYEWIRQRVKNTDEQAFLICPLIEKSENRQSVKAVTIEFEELSKKVFPDLRLGLLHGKLKSKEKETVFDQFREGKIDILVSTPVIEVGIDIPEATIMVIEGAERFGLAQLHQLRGRIGRGKKESYCLLFTQSNDDSTIERLKMLEKTTMGMELAEFDLKLRGPGEIYGTAQHGFPDFKLASFNDLELIQKTRQACDLVLENIDNFPLLIEKLNRFVSKTI